MTNNCNPRFYESILIDTDVYKSSMEPQLEDDVQFKMSYIEARGSNFDFNFDGKIPTLGLYPILQLLEEVITVEKVQRAAGFWNSVSGYFPYAKWMDIATRLEGKLPLEIRAIPEGTVVPMKNALVTVENTDPEHAWLVTWVETKLLRMWYPSTVSAKSLFVKKLLLEYAEKTIDGYNSMPEGLLAKEDMNIDFSLHDFGSRGVSSTESAAIGGMGHLLNFRGSDTAAAIAFIAATYGNADNIPVGFGIAGSEHSTMTPFGRGEGEVKACARMIEKFGKGMFSVVSDSFDFENCVTNVWGGALKEAVQNIEGRLVVRPDSGDPVETPVWAVEELYRIFGGTVNSKGYKVLNDKVRVIQGDGIDVLEVRQILDRLERKGFSTENMAFGMGGGLLQKVNRDTLKFAMKCCASFNGTEWTDVYKEPKGDATKKSKSGRLGLVMSDEGQFETVRLDEIGDRDNELGIVYKDGECFFTTWDDVMSSYDASVNL